MGFAEDLAIRALVASYNNVNRASELLLSGNVPPLTTPTNSNPNPTNTAVPPNTQRGSQGGPSAGPAAGPATGQLPGQRPGAFPQINRALLQRLKDEVLHLPDEEKLRILKQTQILFDSKPTDFLTLMNQNILNLNPELSEKVKGDPKKLLNLFGYAVHQTTRGLSLEKPMRTLDTHLTDEDNEAIRNLIDLGFDPEACRRAYLMANKDANIAADILYHNPDA